MPWDKSLWPTLSPLLDEALDLEAEARADFLGRLRLDAPAVAEALERLLDEHSLMQASSFLADGLDLTADAPASLAGHTIGAYVLERPLGMGGMGTVWLARRGDGRFEGAVAVKLLHLGALDAVAQVRFRREGTMLARLSHPHIARLLDAGVTPAGQPFLVLEYVEGTRIDRFVRDQRLDIPGRLHLFLQVAEAVAHAHTNLVVHRDLKPSNILVDAAGQVKLLDFGIGTLLDDGDDREPGTLTLAAGRALTPEYAAPEQVSSGGMTTATDVYALGVLLYQLLAGRHPTAWRARTDAEIVRALFDEEPVRPSDVARRLRADDPDAVRMLDERRTTAHRLQRACRGDLDVIVGRALKKRPDERYRTVAAFAADIRRHLNDEPVLAQPDTWSYRARKFVSRRRIEVAAAALAALALTIGAGIAVRQARISAGERDQALASLRRAEATNDLSAFLLSEARPAGKPISNAELLARGEAIVQARHGDSPELKVHLLLTLADRYQENQQFDAMARVLGQAYDASRSLADIGLRAYAECYTSLPVVERGDLTAALAVVDRALNDMASASNAAEYEGACRELESTAARRAGDGARAVRAAERAVALEERGVGSARRLHAALLALAAAYAFDQRHAAASAAYQRLVSIFEAEGRAATLNAAVIFNNWSAGLQDAGLLLQSVVPGQRAVRTARAADSENGASLTMLSTYANALVAVGRHTDATPLFDEAIVKAREAGAAPRLRQILTTAAIAAAETGDIERAERLASEARPLARSGVERGIAQRVEASLAEASGQRPVALGWAGQAVETLTAAGAVRVTRMRAQSELARLLNANGQFGAALSVAEQVQQSASEVLGDLPHSSHMGRALLEIAAARCGLGERERARSTLSLALEHLRATTGPESGPTRRALSLERGLGQTSPECVP